MWIQDDIICIKMDFAKFFIFPLQLLSEANTTISTLQEQLGSLNQSAGGEKETTSSRLQDSTGQFQAIQPVAFLLLILPNSNP